MNPGFFPGMGGPIEAPMGALVPDELMETWTLFLASGAYALPHWAQFVDAFVIGGGGSGADNNDDAVWASEAGSAGAFACARFLRHWLATSIAVTVGAGGAVPGGMGNGSAGGASSFGSLVTAAGGAAGRYTFGVAYGGQAGGAATIASGGHALFSASGATAGTYLGAGAGRRTRGWSLPFVAADALDQAFGSGSGVNDTAPGGAGAVLVRAGRFPHPLTLTQ